MYFIYIYKFILYYFINYIRSIHNIDKIARKCATSFDPILNLHRLHVCMTLLHLTQFRRFAQLSISNVICSGELVFPDTAFNKNIRQISFTINGMRRMLIVGKS